MENKTLRELWFDYDACDSLSQRSLLSENIVSSVSGYLDKVYSNTLAITGDTKNTIFDMSDYLPDRGYIKIYEIYDDRVSVAYSDLWVKGGYCNDVFQINFEEYERFDEKSFIQSLKEQKKASVEFKIKSLQNLIVELRGELTIL